MSVEYDTYLLIDNAPMCDHVCIVSLEMTFITQCIISACLAYISVHCYFRFGVNKELLSKGNQVYGPDPHGFYSRGQCSEIKCLNTRQHLVSTLGNFILSLAEAEIICSGI